MTTMELIIIIIILSVNLNGDDGTNYHCHTEQVDAVRFEENTTNQFGAPR